MLKTAFTRSRRGIQPTSCLFWIKVGSIMKTFRTGSSATSISRSHLNVIYNEKWINHKLHKFRQKILRLFKSSLKSNSSRPIKYALIQWRSQGDHLQAVDLYLGSRGNSWIHSELLMLHYPSRFFNWERQSFEIYRNNMTFRNT